MEEWNKHEEILAWDYLTAKERATNARHLTNRQLIQMLVHCTRYSSILRAEIRVREYHNQIDITDMDQEERRRTLPKLVVIDLVPRQYGHVRFWDPRNYANIFEYAIANKYNMQHFKPRGDWTKASSRESMETQLWRARQRGETWDQLSRGLQSWYPWLIKYIQSWDDKRRLERRIARGRV